MSSTIQFLNGTNALQGDKHAVELFVKLDQASMDTVTAKTVAGIWMINPVPGGYSKVGVWSENENKSKEYFKKHFPDAKFKGENNILWWILGGVGLAVGGYFALKPKKKAPVK